MIGTKFYKTDFDAEAYASAAEWCNANGARIEDKGDCYEVVAIPDPTLEEAKAAKMAWNHAYADGLLAQAKAGYTLGEIESWDVQKRGAADILAGNTATEDAQDVTALYDRRIAVGGETMTLEQFCQRILANAAAYRAYSANVNGIMQGIDAIIRRCETVEQVQAVVWPEM